jgi:hypothetical protein
VPDASEAVAPRWSTIGRPDDGVDNHRGWPENRLTFSLSALVIDDDPDFQGGGIGDNLLAIAVRGWGMVPLRNMSVTHGVSSKIERKWSMLYSRSNGGQIGLFYFI